MPRCLVPLLALLALAGCTERTGPVARAPPRTTAATAPASRPAVRHRRPSDGYAVTQLGHLRLFSRRVSGGRFVLMEQRLPEGGPRRAPGVRSSRLPFQVDLGTDARGSAVAVFARCELGRSAVDGASSEVDHCRIGMWDPGAGREHLLPQLDGPIGTSAVWPSIDHGSITFAREADDADDRDTVTVWRATTSTSAPRRIARLPLQDVAGLQARGHLVALTGFTSTAYDQGGMGTYPVLLLGDAAPVEELSYGGLGLETDLEPRGLTFIGDELTWAIGDLSVGEEVGQSSVERYDLRTGSLISAPVRAALTGLTGTTFRGLVATETDPASDFNRLLRGTIHLHERIRLLHGLEFEAVERDLGGDVG